MINKPFFFKGLNIRIPIIIPIKGRDYIPYMPFKVPRIPRRALRAHRLAFG